MLAGVAADAAVVIALKKASTATSGSCGDLMYAGRSTDQFGN